MRGQRHLSFIGLATLMLCGIADAAQPNASGPQLGQSLGGEACHADGVLTEARPVDIFCGVNTQSVGSLQVSTLGAPLPADATARRAAILARARSIAGTLSVSQQLSCAAGQFLSDASSSDVLKTARNSNRANPGKPPGNAVNKRCSGVLLVYPSANYRAPTPNIAVVEIN